MKKNILLLFILLCIAAISCRGQLYSVKTSLPALATTNLNLAFEVAIAPKVSLELHGYANPWRFNDRFDFTVIGAQPGVRYWLRDTYAGSFFGAHMGVAAGELTFRGRSYQGFFVSGGVSYGYAWMIATRWNLEAEGGVGVYNFQYRAHDPGDEMDGTDEKNLFAPTKLSLNLAYLF